MNKRLFEEIPDRRDTHSLKWAKYRGRDILPLWVADMDFKSPPEVVNEAKKAAEAAELKAKQDAELKIKKEAELKAKAEADKIAK